MFFDMFWTAYVPFATAILSLMADWLIGCRFFNRLRCFQPHTESVASIQPSRRDGLQPARIEGEH
jgi:hypothetical protein